MSIDNFDTIDAIGFDESTNEVVLMISDHFNWSDEQLHLSILQSKINAYFNFVTSGQLYEVHPVAKESGLRIDCICSYPAPDSTEWFAGEVRKAAAPLNIGFNFQTLAPEASKIAELNS